MNSIAISGITGFVGVNLEKYLISKKKVNILGVSRLVNKNSKKDVINYQQIQKSVLDECLAFIHLAGKAHDLKKTSDDAAYFEVNTELTKKLFNQFLESNCKVFIYMSSVKAAADEVEGVLIENVTPTPVTAYGLSKLAAENYILSKEIPEGKRVYILRPCMIHGPNNKGNLNLLYSFVAKGIPYPFGRFENKRSFVSVENLCFIINELLDNANVASGVYNIADDTSLSTKDLVAFIGQKINKPSKIINFPKFLIKSIAKIGDFLPLPINSERMQKLTESYEVSNRKIKKAIKKQLPLSSKQGIEKTIESF